MPTESRAVILLVICDELISTDPRLRNCELENTQMSSNLLQGYQGLTK